jgi:O-methyltransferase
VKGIEDNFAFVSIDADLYKPIYDGLVYFYKNLSNGGYIFVHDFNNAYFSGSGKAVEKF